MNSSHVFISHGSGDDAFVKDLRQALEGLGLKTWVDSRELAAGSKLAPEIEQAIERARQFVAVISTDSVNSPWVRKEIQKALEVERRRGGEGYRVIPLLLPGVEPPALALWFGEEPVAVPVRIGDAGGLGEALPALLTALGERLPDDVRRIAEVAPPPVEELVLRMTLLKMQEAEGVRRAQALAQLVYEPADKTARNVEGRSYTGRPCRRRRLRKSSACGRRAGRRSAASQSSSMMSCRKAPARASGSRRRRPRPNCSRCPGSCCTKGAASSSTAGIR